MWWRQKSVCNGSDGTQGSPPSFDGKVGIWVEQLTFQKPTGKFLPPTINCQCWDFNHLVIEAFQLFLQISQIALSLTWMDVPRWFSARPAWHFCRHGNWRWRWEWRVRDRQGHWGGRNKREIEGRTPYCQTPLLSSSHRASISAPELWDR